MICTSVSNPSPGDGSLYVQPSPTRPAWTTASSGPTAIQPFVSPDPICCFHTTVPADETPHPGQLQSAHEHLPVHAPMTLKRPAACPRSVTAVAALLALRRVVERPAVDARPAL